MEESLDMTETFDVAYVREQGQDMVIVPVKPQHRRSPQDVTSLKLALQLGAQSAGLRGTVVPVWDQDGRMGFLAPRPWHPFFRGLTLQDVFAMINKRLTLTV
jgi:hypothetical protein